MADTQPEAMAPETVKFHYIKSNFFRVIHMDGGIGGITPRGFVHISLYSERPALPRTTEITIDGGELVGEATLDAREGFVRELEVDVLMTQANAIELREWLDKQIHALELVNKQSDSTK